MDLRKINDITTLKAMAYDVMQVKQDAEDDLVKINRRMEQIQAEQAEAAAQAAAKPPKKPKKAGAK